MYKSKGNELATILDSQCYKTFLQLWSQYYISKGCWVALMNLPFKWGWTTGMVIFFTLFPFLWSWQKQWPEFQQPSCDLEIDIYLSKMAEQKERCHISNGLKINAIQISECYFWISHIWAKKKHEINVYFLKSTIIILCDL